MKNYIYVAFLFFSFNTFSQTTFWSEDFGTGCTTQYVSAYTSTNGAWAAITTGTQGFNPNAWFVSSAEAGMGVGNCGDGCINNPGLTNATLHMSMDFGQGFQDFGATYAAGQGYETDSRAQSPLINCSSKTNITLSLLYMLEGVPGADFMEIHYSADGGTTWTVLATPPPTNNGACSGQGLWTTYSVSLPSSANNNSNVKIGFRWVNSDPNGSDPAPAIDDIQLTTPLVFAPTFTVNPTSCIYTQQQLIANTGTFAVSGYTWTSAPAGPIFSSPNASTTVISFTSTGTFSVTLTATSGTTTANDVHIITVSSPPAIVAAANPNPGCAGQQFTLVASGASSYTWNPGNLTGANVVVSPVVPTSYTVTGSTNGCASTATTVIGMYNSPVVNVTSSSSLICTGNNATLTASGASSFTWAPGGSTAYSVVVSPTVSTTYTVVGSNGFCTNTKTVSLVVSPCTSVLNLSNNNGNYSVYPNPTRDKFQIVSANIGEALVEISDLVGKVVLIQSCKFENSNEPQTINVHELPAGLYLVKISSLQEIRLLRVIKQ